MSDTYKNDCKMCPVPLKGSIHSRRCFMSGEHCSKLANIQKERDRLHLRGEINAFVIMNFSNMSDVVYNWRIKPFIESLKKYLTISQNEITCHATPVQNSAPHSGKKSCESSSVNQSEKDIENCNGQCSEYQRVKKINVIRADSNYASNYVVCNRVCQQMQIADLIIVDASSENTNVFYEFGMAVSLGKLILPICYSESFFEIVIPEKLLKYEEKYTDAIDNFPQYELKHRGESKPDFEYIKRHIDCYPWRRTLFEHYGIRYRSKDDSEILGEAPKVPVNDTNKEWKKVKPFGKEKHDRVTQYLEFKDAEDKRFGFSDIQYSRFPYVEKSENNGMTIGEKIYTRLGNSYNNSRYIHNTLVVYTLDGFLNEEQAGQCIINFYRFVVSQMKEQHCFCGDRVGVLIQANAIPEGVKDAKKEKHLLYNVGEIIHIGMNQATYNTNREIIKTKDYLRVPSTVLNNQAEGNETADTDTQDLDATKTTEPAQTDLTESTDPAKNTKKQNSKEAPFWLEDITIFVKNHIRNKSISVYPSTPVYVNRIKKGLQQDILEIKETTDPYLHYYFCLYHVMLNTLQFTNELVVDISKNPLQSLFWLGAAHGSNIHAITVQHEESEKERTITTGSPEKRERAIFDVAGLWSAILRSYDTEGFYRQLTLAQLGIEQHSKLMLKDLEYYERQMIDCLYKDIRNSQMSSTSQDNPKTIIFDLFNEKEQEEQVALESYYRDRFWKPMLRYEHLRIYLPQVDAIDIQTKRLKLNTVKWDVDAIANISHYLSRRKLVGEYSFQTLKKGKADKIADTANFITVGNDARPLSGKDGRAWSLAKYIQSLEKDSTADIKTGKNVIHTHAEIAIGEILPSEDCKQRIYKGFVFKEGISHHCLFTQTSEPDCYGCIVQNTDQITKEKTPIFLMKDKEECSADKKEDGPLAKKTCVLKKAGVEHIQLAQLVLWREIDEEQKKVLFRVSLTGASGPSTLALSTLLINEAQRESAFKLKKGSLTGVNKQSIGSGQIAQMAMQEYMKKPLSDLQEGIRKKITQYFIEALDNGIKLPQEVTSTDTDGEEVLSQIKYASVLYLSSVLYRHFLPFLSFEDEETLINGMRYFLSSLLNSGTIKIPEVAKKEKGNATDSKQISLKSQLLEQSVGALSEMLKNFRGIEAMYEVNVEVTKVATSDSREILGIQPLRLDNKNAYMNCLFVKRKESDNKPANKI